MKTFNLKIQYSSGITAEVMGITEVITAELLEHLVSNRDLVFYFPTGTSMVYARISAIESIEVTENDNRESD